MVRWPPIALVPFPTSLPPPPFPPQESYVNPRMQPLPVAEGSVPVKKPANNRKTRLKRIALRQSQIRRSKEVKARTASRGAEQAEAPQSTN